MLCTRAAAFLVGSVVLPRFQAKAAATKATEAFCSRQRALEAAANEESTARHTSGVLGRVWLGSGVAGSCVSHQH